VKTWLMNSTSNFKHDIKKTSILPLLVDGKLNTIFEKISRIKVINKYV
jgi:hypothetical protein